MERDGGREDIQLEPLRSDLRGGPTERAWARSRVEKKRKFRSDLVAYVVVNLFLIGAWALTGGGYFWPGWVLAGWGVLMLLEAWNLYFRQPVTDDEVDRELRRMRRV